MRKLITTIAIQLMTILFVTAQAPSNVKYENLPGKWDVIVQLENFELDEGGSRDVIIKDFYGDINYHFTSNSQVTKTILKDGKSTDYTYKYYYDDKHLTLLGNEDNKIIYEVMKLTDKHMQLVQTDGIYGKRHLDFDDMKTGDCQYVTIWLKKVK